MYKPADYPSPSKNRELQTTIWHGVIRGALQHCFDKSSEDDVYLQKLPKERVFANKNFNKGQCKLVALTGNVQIVARDDPAAQRAQNEAKSVMLNECFKHGGKSYVALANKHCTYPVERTVVTGIAVRQKRLSFSW